MSQVKPKDTLPEIRVRKMAHSMGYRFRLHRKDLPGKPDIVFPRLKLVIFVHGCFWHRHTGCSKAGKPKSKVDFWEKKFDRNIARDAEAVALLEKMGWAVSIIWECETKSAPSLRARVAEAISRGKPKHERGLRH
jgi:DNA mismatch endonuclease (patch repair protein)